MRVDVDKLAQAITSGPGTRGLNLYLNCITLARAVLERGERIKAVEAERDRWISMDGNLCCEAMTIIAQMDKVAAERDALKTDNARLRSALAGLDAAGLLAPPCLKSDDCAGCNAIIKAREALEGESS